MYDLLFECRFKEPTALLEQAQKEGFDPGEVEVKANAGQSLGISVGGGVMARPNASALGGAAPADSVVPSSRAALQQMSTDEELSLHQARKTGAHASAS